MVSFFPDKSKRPGRTARGGGVARGLPCGIGGEGDRIKSGQAIGQKCSRGQRCGRRGGGVNFAWPENIFDRNTVQLYRKNTIGGGRGQYVKSLPEDNSTTVCLLYVH